MTRSVKKKKGLSLLFLKKSGKYHQSLKTNLYLLDYNTVPLLLGVGHCMIN